MADLDRVVRNKARERDAEWWVDALDELLAGLAADWDLSIGDPLPGGTEAHVVAVTMADGRPAVLKLLVPNSPAGNNEAAMLERIGGAGCVELYRSDDERGALLLERLGPSIFDLGLPLAERTEIMLDAAQQIWRPAPGLPLRTGASKAAWLAEFIVETWERTAFACSEVAVAHALRCAERRRLAHDDERAVLNHGDVHQWNCLQAGDGYKLIDPDGLLAEPEYDLGVLLREDPVDLMALADPRDRSRMMAAHTGTDAEAIWEWGVVERVSTGLLCETIDLQPEGRNMLDAADRLALAE